MKLSGQVFPIDSVVSGSFYTNAPTGAPGDLTASAELRIERFRAGARTFITGSSITLNVGALTNASGSLDHIGPVEDTETITIDGKVYTFQDSLTDSDGNVQASDEQSGSVENLWAAINSSSFGGTGAGTRYAASMTIHPTVSASIGPNTASLLLTAKEPGLYGNDITVTDTSTSASWASGSTMLGGNDAYHTYNIELAHADISAQVDDEYDVVIHNGSVDGTRVNGTIIGSFYAGAVIRGQVAFHEGTLQHGEASLVTLASDAPSDDIFGGSIIHLYDGTGAGQTRVLTNYTGSSKSASVDPDFVTIPDTTTKYTIFPSPPSPDVNTPSVNVTHWSGSAVIEKFHDGTLQHGEASLIALASDAPSDNILAGSIVHIYDGTGEGQTRLMVNYTGSSKSASVDPDFTIVPDTTSKYVIFPAAPSPAVNTPDVNVTHWSGSVVPEQLHNGTLQHGEASLVALASDAPSTDVYGGSVIYIYRGTGVGQTRLMVNYTGSSKSASVDPDFTVTPDTTSEYIVFPSPPSPDVNTPSVNITHWSGSAVLEQVLFHQGTLQHGEASLVALASDASSDDIYGGSTIHIYSGTGVGQTRYITSYTGSSKSASVDPDFTVNPDTTSKYVIFPGAPSPVLSPPSVNVSHWSGSVAVEQYVSSSEVRAKMDEALAAINLNFLLAAADDVANIQSGSYLQQMLTTGSVPSDYDRTTDSLQALGDGAGGATPSQVRTEIDAAFTGSKLHVMWSNPEGISNLISGSYFDQILGTGSVPNTYDPSTDSLEALAAGAGLTAGEVRTEIDAALTGSRLHFLISNPDGIANVISGSYLDQILDDGTATYDRTSDSLQAIADGGSGLTAGDILADGTKISGSVINNTMPVRGDVRSGNTSSVGLPTNAPSTDAVLAGAVVFLSGGAAHGQTRLIVSWTGSVQSASVDPAWDVIPTTESYAYVFAVPPAPEVYLPDVDVKAWSGSVVTGGAIPNAVASTSGGLAVVGDNNYISGISGSINVLDQLNDVSGSEVRTHVDEALVAIDLDHLLNVAQGIGSVVSGSYLDQVLGSGSVPNTYDPSTDSLEALADGALAGATPTQVRTEMDQAISGASLHFLLANPDGIANIISGSYLDQVLDDGTATYDRTSDSLQAIADGGSGLTAGDILADGIKISGSVINNTMPVRGAVRSGDTASVGLPANSPSTDGVLQGAIVFLSGGVAHGQTRIISEWTGSLQSASVDPAWDVIPTTESYAYVFAVPPAPELYLPDVDIKAWSGSIVTGGAIPNAVASTSGGLAVVGNNNYVSGIIGTANTLDDLNDVSGSEIRTRVDEALVAIDLDHLLNVAQGIDSVVSGSYLSQVLGTGSVPNTYDPSTDSLEALRNRGDSAWITSTLGVSGSEVRTHVDEALVAIDLDHLLNVAQGIGSVVSGSYLDQVLDDGTATYDRTSDSLQAIADGGSGLTAGDILADGVKISGSVVNNTMPVRGAVRSGDTASVGLPANSPSTDGVLQGAVVFLSGGAAHGQTRIISEWTGSLQSASVDPAWDVIPTTESYAFVFAVPPAPEVYLPDVDIKAWSGSVVTGGAIPNAVASTSGGLATVGDNNYISGIIGTANTLDDLNDVSGSEVRTHVDEALVAIDLDHLLNVAQGIDSVVSGSYLSQVLGTGSVPNTYDPSTDSLEALAAGAGLTSGQVRTEMDQAISGASLHFLLANPDGIANVISGSYLDQVLDDGAAAYDRSTDSLQAIRDRGDTAWITGGGSGSAVTEILNVTPLIPESIDLANTASWRIGLMLMNSRDDLPTTAEIDPGTVSVDRKAIGDTSWTAVTTDAAASESNGMVYFDEIFDSSTGYTEGDSLRFTFKSQKITVDANDYEISDATGRIFYTEIRQTMRGTDNASTFDSGSDVVVVVTNQDKTGYSIAGTKTTLDALNDPSLAQISSSILVDGVAFSGSFIDSAISAVPTSSLSAEDIVVGGTPISSSLLDVAVSTRGTSTLAASDIVVGGTPISSSLLDVAVSTRGTSTFDSSSGFVNIDTITSGAVADIADGYLRRNIEGGSDGGRTVTQAFYRLRNRVTRNAVYATDDATPAYTLTSVTGSATGGPVIEVDPS